jgi:hypothetical protein
MLRTAFAALITLALAAGEAEGTKLPPAAQGVIDRLAKAEAKIDADAAKLRSAERQKAIKELEKTQATVTKAGDLEGALAVKGRIEALKKAEEVDAATLLGDETPAGKDPAMLAVGSWNVTKINGIVGLIELAPEKTARASAGPYVITGIWQIEKDRLVIQWGGNPGRWENLGFEGPDRLAGDSHDAGKDGITMTRVRREGRN